MNTFDSNDDETPFDPEHPYGEGYDEEGYVIRPNKSQRHRDALALLELGKKLAELDAGKITRMNLPNELVTALMDVKKIRANGARKRHFKFIAKLLRDIDTQVIEESISDIAYGNTKSNAEFHLIERWRDRLLNADDTSALTDFMAEHVHADSGRMRQLMRNAHKESQQSKPPRSARLLFQMLREIIQG